jgi:hypothetical protein
LTAETTIVLAEGGIDKEKVPSEAELAPKSGLLLLTMIVAFGRGAPLSSMILPVIVLFWADNWVIDMQIHAINSRAFLMVA